MDLVYVFHMAYLPRCEIIHDDAFFHVTWQCHNKDWLLRWDWAKQIYYDLLLKYKDKYGVEIYAYSFMDNHPHLAGHLSSRNKFSRFFQLINSQFAMKINERLKRRGQVVMDRFKSPLIESDRHMLRVMTYIDLNQYRAKKVLHPRKNTWSSYNYYAHGTTDPLITPFPSYMELGENSLERQNAYREMVFVLMDGCERINISHTWLIGDPEWVIANYRNLCKKLGRKVMVATIKRMIQPPG